MAEAYGGKKPRESFGLPDEEFEQFSKEMKVEAQQQAAKNKVKSDDWKKKQAEEKARLKPNETRDI